MLIRSVLIVSVHTSPLAALGGEKTGGMNVYVKELARELGNRGIQVDIFTRRTSQDLPEIDYSLGLNVRVIHVAAGREDVMPPEEIYSHISQFATGVVSFATRHNTKYDLIYSHYWLSGLVATKLRDLWGMPFIQMFHTLGQMKNRITTTPQIIPDIRTINEGRIVEWSDRIIAATPAEQAQLRWLYRADRKKISIVSPGVNNSVFYPIPEHTAKQALGLPLETRHLLFVGRIEPLKAVDTILLALNFIKDSVPELLANIRLTVIGGNVANPVDRELARLRDLTHELELSGQVRFVGAKPQQELRNYYAASVAVIMPSDYESFGMVALEAMACGTPVIASHTGGLAFLIKDGYSGFLVPVRDPSALAARLIALLPNPQLVHKMRKSAIEVAKSYTWSAVADRLIDIFAETKSRSPERISRHMS